MAVQTPAGAFEINITAAGRQPAYQSGRTKISDAVVLKGSIKNTGTRPARTGGPTDMALVHPALKGGLIILPASPVTALGPGQSVSATWAASVNGGKPGANSAFSGLTGLKVTARASISARNTVIGETQALEGLPPI